jgi:Fur family zinc uptake transcriptional regulator
MEPSGLGGSVATGGEGHDHGRCVDTALGRAQRLCEARSVRLTELRRRVLELVWQSHRPIGAYDILERLAAERGRVGPPTVYRALDFLAEQGLVHRLDSLNAFIGCSAPAEGHKAYFLICRECRTVIELVDEGVAGALAGAAARARFRIESETVELAGRCAHCRAEAS